MKRKTRKQIKKLSNEIAQLAPDGINNLDFAIYTKDAYLRSFPDKTEDDWKKTFFPGNLKILLWVLMAQIEQLFAKQDNLDFRLVPIDDEYYEYLNRFNLQDTEDSRVEYITNLSDEDALRIYTKNTKDFIPFMVAGIPITLSTKEIAIKDTEIPTELNEEFRLKIEKFLEYFYGEHNVYVSQYMIKPSVFVNEYKRFYSLADDYLNNNQKIRLSVYSTQNIVKGTNLTRLYIPVLLKIVPTTMRFSKNTIYRPKKDEFRLIYPEFTIFLKETLAQLMDIDITTVPDFDFDKEINNQFPDAKSVSISPYIVAIENIMEHEEEFYTTMKKELKSGFKVINHP